MKPTEVAEQEIVRSVKPEVGDRVRLDWSQSDTDAEEVVGEVVDVTVDQQTSSPVLVIEPEGDRFDGEQWADPQWVTEIVEYAEETDSGTDSNDSEAPR